MSIPMSKRDLFSASVVISSLVLFSGCDMMKNESGQSAGASDGKTLLTIAGKPAVTASEFQDYWNDFLKLDPQAEMMASLLPNARQEVFKNYVMEKVIHHWIKAEGKDQDAGYKKKLDMQRKLAERGVAIQAFQEHVLEQIDKSDGSAEKFYAEQKEKSPIFQQQPFLSKSASLKALGVEFSDEKSAKAFLDKAKRNGDFTALAKEAKKSVVTLGDEKDPQRRGLESNIKTKFADAASLPAYDVIPFGKSYWVVKVTAKTAAQYAPFEEVKEYVKQAMTQTKFPEIFTAEIDRLKKVYNVDDALGKAFFEEEAKKKEAELQDQLKAMQEAQKAEAKEESKEDAQPTAKPASAKAA